MMEEEALVVDENREANKQESHTVTLFSIHCRLDAR
jgi:hypothetical protein